ncbi:MAG: insulinase family protein, partial [Deltaproteobacteria bacterium]
RPLVEKYMGRLKKGEFSLPPRAEEPSREKVEAVFREMESARAYVNIAFPGVALGDEDVFAVDLLSMILGSGETSRLYQSVKEGKNLVDSIYSYSFTPKDPGVLMVGFTCDPDKVRAAVEETLKEIYRIAAEGVTAGELSRAKKKTIADFTYSLESQSSLARLLGFYETAVGDAFFQEKYVEMVQRVTPEKIREVARKYLRENNFVVAGVVPKGSGAAIPPGELEKLAASVYSSVMGETEKRGEASLVKSVLKNGIRLVVRENHSVPVVAVSIGFLGGVRAETEETNGLCNLMSYMLTRGTEKRTAYEIAEEIEDMAASVDSFSGRNSFGIRGEFLSEDFEKGMRLLSEMVLSPTFEEEELEKRKRDVISAIRAQEDSAFQELLKLYLKAQYGDHPYSMDPLGTEETVDSFTRDDVVSLYERLVFPENMVIVISGDVSAEKAKETVQALFEDFSREGDRSIFEAKKVTPPDEPVRVEKKKEKLQAHFMIGFLGARFSEKDRYPLEVLAAALAGQGGRLFRHLRDEKSLAYSLTAFSSEQFDRGFFAFYMGTQAAKKDEAISAMWDEIVSFLKEGLTEEELERAKNFVVGNYEIGLQSNLSWAETITFNELYGTGMEEVTRFPERIRAVTREDILRVARKVIDLDHYVLAVISP